VSDGGAPVRSYVVYVEQRGLFAGVAFASPGARSATVGGLARGVPATVYVLSGNRIGGGWGPGIAAVPG
jgi:hypothetical protein